MAHYETHAEVLEVTPFWLRIPIFFRYPLHFEPLLYMVFLSMATFLAFVLPIPTPFDHLLVLLGVWLAFIRYSYKTLDQTAQGLLSPEQHKEYHDPERANLPYKQFAIFVVIGFVLSFAGAAGGLVFGAVLVFCVLALPASVMNLAITRSFWAGLNPLAAINMMRVIGLPYLGLCAFLFLLSASQQALQMVLLPRLSAWLLLPVMTFVAMYFTLIMFNMMGYVVYQFHHMLGVTLSTSAPALNAKAEAGSVVAIGELIGAGRIDEALDVAYEAQRIEPEDVATNDRYYKLLSMAGRDDRLLSHGQRYLGLLLRKNLGDEALVLYRDLLARNAAFLPEMPAQLLLLAEAARRQRNFAEALGLVKGFDKRFPHHADIPAVYLFAARVLCENLRQDAKARQILTVLLARFPTHPTSTEAQQLLTVIDKMGASATATATISTS